MKKENSILTSLIQSLLHASKKEYWGCVITEHAPDIVSFKIIYYRKEDNSKYDFIDIIIQDKKEVYIAGIYVCEASKLKGFISNKYINYE